MSCRRMELRGGRAFQCNKRTGLDPCISFGGMALPTPRLVISAQGLERRWISLSNNSRGSIEERAVLEHRVHDDGELSGKRNGGALEPEPFLQIEAPGAQAAVHAASHQQNDGRFVEQAPQLRVTPSRDV